MSTMPLTPLPLQHYAGASHQKRNLNLQEDEDVEECMPSRGPRRARLHVLDPAALQRESLPYVAKNDFLRRLHFEGRTRRLVASSDCMTDKGFPPAPSYSSSALTAHDGMSHGMMEDTDSVALATCSDGLTSFTLGDLLRCSHNPFARCVQCSGRRVCNVPLEVQRIFEAAMEPAGWSPAQSSTAGRSRPSADVIGGEELSLAALAELCEHLELKSTSKVLHLWGGCGRLAAAFALLAPPGSTFCMIEPGATSHQKAARSLSRLSSSLHPRVFVRQGEPLAMQPCWREADTIIASCGGMADFTAKLLAEGLHDLRPGTRVVVFTRELYTLGPCEVVGAPRLLRSSTGNVTAFLYRRW
eukprot:TRINITY_DN26025_c0_g2_i1.p1 TRINITY_DN26025_c0_g2~~TRINITY_DN26025_c0_g2_i1.p1  ORF type:complete len:357 (+),score=51.50 TRINITY_DN26025_c0_g2_i1:51-1121(+)